MRMPQNRVECDAGSQHCYAGESSEFSLESRTTTCFLGFVFPGNPHSDPPHPSLQAVFDPLPSFYLTPQWLQCRAPAVQARFVNGRVRPLCRAVHNVRYAQCSVMSSWVGARARSPSCRDPCSCREAVHNFVILSGAKGDKSLLALRTVTSSPAVQRPVRIPGI